MCDLPKISIVTPSYNQAQFLERTIISVLNQNYPNLEYIIIDGGSTDESSRIIRSYEEHLTYWVSEPDAGQSDALNKGFARATGKILAWLNSDDLYLPKALFKAAHTFVKNPNAAVVYGDYILIDANDVCTALRRQPSFDYQIFLHAYGIVPQPASFFNSEAFFNVGGIDSGFDYVMDYDLLLRLAQYGKIVHIREYLAAFRFHSTSKTVAEKHRFSAEHRRALLKNIGRNPSRSALRVLHSYHRIRSYLCKLREGCILSRFGKDDGEYKLKRIYTPKLMVTPKVKTKNWQS